MVSSFKNDDKFTGNLGEDNGDCIGNYIDVFTDYDLDQHQKIRYLHNLFHEEEARRLYRLKLSNNTTFQDAFALMKQEFKI